MVVLQDLHTRVGNDMIEGIVGQYGVPERNESGERLLEMCAEQELVVLTVCSRKKNVHKCTWVSDKALIHFVLLPR